jgi:hypothetical protein
MSVLKRNARATTEGRWAETNYWSNVYENIGAYKGYPHLGSLILRNLVWMAYDDSNIFIVGVIAFSSYL